MGARNRAARGGGRANGKHAGRPHLRGGGEGRPRQHQEEAGGAHRDERDHGRGIPGQLLPLREDGPQEGRSRIAPTRPRSRKRATSATAEQEPGREGSGTGSETRCGATCGIVNDHHTRKCPDQTCLSCSAKGHAKEGCKPGEKKEESKTPFQVSVGRRRAGEAAWSSRLLRKSKRQWWVSTRMRSGDRVGGACASAWPNGGRRTWCSKAWPTSW